MLSTDNYTQKLLGLEDVIITKVQRNLNETLIFIELPKKTHICPYCDSKTTRINNYRLQKIKDDYGFKNVCEFNTALLNLLCQYIDAADIRGCIGSDNTTDSEVITNMFNDLGNWEHTPDGIVPVRHNKNNKDI